MKKSWKFLIWATQVFTGRRQYTRFCIRTTCWLCDLQELTLDPWPSLLHRPHGHELLLYRQLHVSCTGCWAALETQSVQVSILSSCTIYKRDFIASQESQNLDFCRRSFLPTAWTPTTPVPEAPISYWWIPFGIIRHFLIVMNNDLLFYPHLFSLYLQLLHVFIIIIISLHINTCRFFFLFD